MLWDCVWKTRRSHWRFKYDKKRKDKEGLNDNNSNNDNHSNASKTKQNPRKNTFSSKQKVGDSKSKNIDNEYSDLDDNESKDESVANENGETDDENLGDAIAVTVIATGFAVDQQDEIVNTESKK